MKKVVLLFFTLLITTAGFSQGILSLFSKSEAFFQLLEQEKFTEAHEFFDVSVHSKISPENLKQIWTGLNTAFGKLEAIDVVQSKSQGEYYLVSIDAKFAKDTQGFMLVFNKAEKLVGLLPRDKSNAISYLKPSYADSTLYKEKEIYVKTPGHDLVGLLTTPSSGADYPVVILLHGSGPGDMDETVGPNKPFKDLAAGLAGRGIATIRYVKRTLSYSGEKVPTVKEEVLDDALAAIALARTTPGVNKKQIYIFGHSMGGMLAPRIATLAPDLSGIILAAAPARKLSDLMAEQNKYAAELIKDTTGIVKTQLAEALKAIDQTRITKLGTIKADSLLLGLPASYWVDLNVYDQVATAKKLVNQRIFVIQGGNDFQVSEQDYKIWETALGTKKNVKLKFYPDLNHLLSPQNEKGDPGQYKIPSNVSATLINDVAFWIRGK